MSYRNRSGVGSGVASCVGGGVSAGSADGFGVGVGVSFFLDVFFFGSGSSSSPSDFFSMNMRRWSVLPVCNGITTCSYSVLARAFFFLDFGLDDWKSGNDSQPAPPKAKQKRTKTAIKRWCIGNCSFAGEGIRN